MSIEHRLHARCACRSSIALANSQSGGGRPFAFAGTKRVYERPRPFTIRHLALDLTLDPPNRSVFGTALLEVERIDRTKKELDLDAVGFEITSVEVEGSKGFAPADYAYEGSMLSITLGDRFSSGKVRVTYRAVPTRGLYFLEPDEHVKDRPRQVWSQCQDEDARHWFPCHDKPHAKMTFELSVKVPKGWFALSNGSLASRQVPPSAKHWRYHWKMEDPLPSYLVTLVAGEFAELEGGKVGEVPVSYFVPRGREKDGKRTFARTPEMVEHFSKITGVPYPWNKYAQIVVSDFIFGGMENTTATTMYEHILLDERAALDVSSDDLIAHELAHHWFGDYVTCRDWSHGWLNEGFATFMELVDREARLGKDEYDYAARGDLLSYLSEANGRYRRPIVCQDYEAPVEIFHRHLYEKGALVLHMLRGLLGEGVFWKGVNAYLTRHARSVVETRDLMRAMEEVSGRSLDQFFEQWVYRPGHPELEVKVEHDAGVLTLSVKQAQKMDKDVPYFAFPLTIDIVSPGGRVRRETRQLDQPIETISFACAERPHFVVVDPEFALLADLRVDAPTDMLRRQLLEAPTARGRWLAAAPLGKKADPASLEALSKVLRNEKEFWGVRSQAADALATARTDAAFESLSFALKAKHPKVRRAVVRAIGQFRTPRACTALQPFALSDPSYLVEAEAARALGSTRQRAAFETLVDIIDRPSWADVIRSGALDGLAALRDERGVSHVLARTRYGVNARGRRAAIMALPKLGNDRKNREALEDLLDDRDPLVRLDVVRALGEFGDPKSRTALSKQLEREQDGRVHRRIRESLQEAWGGAKEKQQRMRDEFETLKNEHAELRAAVAKLEAKLTSKAGKPGKPGKPAKAAKEG